MIKLNLKVLIFTVGIVLALVNINKKYGKYKEVLNNRKILIENKRNLESKIVNVVEQKNLERRRIMNEYNQITALTKKLSFLSMKSQNPKISGRETATDLNIFILQCTEA